MRGGGFAILLGLVVTLWCGSLWWSWSQAARWPKVTGTLLSADLLTRHDTDSDQHDSVTYAPDVRYRYTVNGREYLGARYSRGDWSSHYLIQLAKINALRQRQTEKGSIDVHYDPRKPGESALDVRVSPAVFVGFNGGLFILTAGLSSAFPGPGASTYGKLTAGTLLAVLFLGIPYSLFGWSVNAFLMIAWAVCLVVPFTGLAAPKPFRSARRLK